MFFNIIKLDQDNEPCELLLVSLYSAARQKDTQYNAYVPIQDSSSERFPVLYLLHGAMDNYMSWEREAEKELRDLAVKYRVVIITPDCEEYGWYLDSPIISKNQIETYLTKELIPHINHNLLPDKVNGLQSIGGISMGGHGAISIALKDLIAKRNTFQSASSISGILDLTFHSESWNISTLLGSLEEYPKRWEAHSVLHLTKRYPHIASKLPIYFTVGDEDEAALRDNKEYSKALNELGVNYNKQVIYKGDHDWDFWSKQLARHIQWHSRKLRKIHQD